MGLSIWATEEQKGMNEKEIESLLKGLALGVKSELISSVLSSASLSSALHAELLGSELCESLLRYSM